MKKKSVYVRNRIEKRALHIRDSYENAKTVCPRPRGLMHTFCRLFDYYVCEHRIAYGPSESPCRSSGRRRSSIQIFKDRVRENAPAYTLDTTQDRGRTLSVRRALQIDPEAELTTADGYGVGDMTTRACKVRSPGSEDSALYFELLRWTLDGGFSF